mgnify:CR=1 FL=1
MEVFWGPYRSLLRVGYFAAEGLWQPNSATKTPATWHEQISTVTIMVIMEKKKVRTCCAFLVCLPTTWAYFAEKNSFLGWHRPWTDLDIENPKNYRIRHLPPSNRILWCVEDVSVRMDTWLRLVVIRACFRNFKFACALGLMQPVSQCQTASPSPAHVCHAASSIPRLHAVQ